jgi:hypothetical protein
MMLEALLFAFAVWLVSLRLVIGWRTQRNDGPPVVVYRPGDAWAAKARRGR